MRQRTGRLKFSAKSGPQVLSTLAHVTHLSGWEVLLIQATWFTVKLISLVPDQHSSRGVHYLTLAGGVAVSQVHWGPRVALLLPALP